MQRKRTTRIRRSKPYFSKAYKTFLAHADKLRGKYVVIVDSRIFAADTGEEASRLLAQVRKDFPGKTPLATYLPKEETLILWL